MEPVFDCMSPNLLAAEPDPGDITASGNRAPFKFSLSQTSYVMGTRLELTLSAEGSEMIEQYMVAPKRPAPSVRLVGRFTHASVGLIRMCREGDLPNTAVSFGDEDITSVTFTWMAINETLTDVRFQAVVIDQQGRLYDNINSILVSVVEGDDQEDGGDDGGVHDLESEEDEGEEDGDDEEDDAQLEDDDNPGPDPDEDPNAYEKEEEKKSHLDEDGETQDQADDESEREDPSDEDGDPWDGQLDDEVRKMEEDQAIKEEQEQLEEIGSELNTQMEEEEEEERLLEIERERLEGEKLRAELAENARKILEWEMQDLENYLKGMTDSEEEEEEEEPEESSEESSEEEEPHESDEVPISSEESEEIPRGIGGSGAVVCSVSLIILSMAAWLL